MQVEENEAIIANYSQICLNSKFLKFTYLISRNAFLFMPNVFRNKHVISTTFIYD